MNVRLKVFSIAMLVMLAVVYIVGTAGIKLKQDMHHYSDSGCYGILCGPAEHASGHNFIILQLVSAAASILEQQIFAQIAIGRQSVTFAPPAPPPEVFLS